MNDLERICYFVLAVAGMALVGCAPSSREPSGDSCSSGGDLVSPNGLPLRPREATEREAERIRLAYEALAGAPDDIDAIIEAALAREDLWRYSEAIDLYARGIILAPDDYRLYLGRAHLLMRIRRFDEALADLNRSAELDPYGFNTALPSRTRSLSPRTVRRRGGGGPHTTRRGRRVTASSPIQ